MSKDQSKGWLGRIARIAVLSILLSTVAAVGYGVYAIGLPAWQTLQAEQVTLAEALDDTTLRADAACSRGCLELSAVLLAGSLLFVLVPSLWWADAVAALRRD